MATLAANAAVTQFDASRHATFTLSAGNTVQEWRSVRTGATLIPLHGASNGWDSAVVSHGARLAVSFIANGSAIPSPLSFGENNDTPVSTVFAVVKCAAPARLSTLLDTPVDVRTTAKPSLLPSWAFPTEQLGNTVEYRINGAATSDFTPSSAYQLVEARFPSPLELSDIFIGGSIPSPLWKRNWRGEIAELLFFPMTPSPEQRNALHHYLSRKWGVPAPYSHSHASPALLASLGISTGDIFNTAIIVR